MAQSRMQIRDMEILRTLLRLRYVTTRELVAGFFQGERVGPRRLQVLSGRGLIRAHSKGLPPRSNYRAWRLTADGIDVISREFPDESVADGLAERLAEGSLYNLDHREEISRVYLDLVRGRGPEPSQAATPIQRAAMMRRRANQIAWQADGAVSLRYEYSGKDYVIVPDATITSLVRPVRLFLELDRSTKTLGRIKENLGQYRVYLRDVYAQHYKDDRKAGVVYVARSAARQQSISKLAKETLGRDLRRAVLRCRHTTEYVQSQLLDLERVEDLSPPPADSVPLAKYQDLARASRSMFNWTNKLVRHLQGRGLLDPVIETAPELISEGKIEMGVLYKLLAEPSHGG